MQLPVIIEIIDFIKKEIESKQIIAKYETLLAVLKKIGNTSDGDFSGELLKAQNDLIAALNETEPVNWAYSRHKLLLEIDRDCIIGDRAVKTLDTIFSKNQANPGKIAKEINKIIGNINKILQSSTDALKILSNLSADDSGKEEKTLLTLFFEGKTSVETINDIERYSRIWDGIINDFAILTMNSECQPGIENIDKKSMILNIPDGDKILEALSYGIGRIIDTYDKILRIRLLQLEVVKLSLNDEIRDLLEEEINVTINETSREVVSELMEIHEWKNRQGKDDLFNSVQKSMKLILDFIEKGGKFECQLVKNNSEIDKRNKLLLTVYQVVIRIEETMGEISLLKNITE